MAELNPNQVELTDGRVVALRETTGSDEIAAGAMLGKHFTQDAAGIGMYTKALVHRSITDIDGKPLNTGPIKFADFRAFWAEIKTRDSQRLMKKYQELNGDDEPRGGSDKSPLDDE